MHAMLDSHSSEEPQELSVEQNFKYQFTSLKRFKYLVNKTVIFGEGDKFSGVLYLEHDELADDIVQFYRKI